MLAGHQPAQRARPGEQARWERAYETWWWLDRYHMGPDRTGEIPLDEIDLIPQIAELAEEIRQERLDRASER